jgi:hypothetical protein
MDVVEFLWLREGAPAKKKGRFVESVTKLENLEH